MGSKVSPTFDNLFMGAVETDIIWGPSATQWIDHIVFWGRYIDDCLLLWSGSQEQLLEFYEHLNRNVWGIRFTMQCSVSHIEFLDVELYVRDNMLHSRLYRKQTACNSILHAESFHPHHQISSIPYGELIRARRNCSEVHEFNACRDDMKKRFENRGYSQTVIQQAAHKVNHMQREETLRNRVKTPGQMQPIRMITEFNDLQKVIKRSFNKHWRILQADKSIQEHIPKFPAITFRKGMNLHRRLSPTVPIRCKDTNWLQRLSKGFYKCGHCSMCYWTKHGVQDFEGHDGRKYTINNNVNCNSKFVVYIIECVCKKYYVGSTIRPLRERMAEHIRAIQKQDPKYPVALHVATCQAQGMQKRVQFFGIDITPINTRGGNRELRLRRNEAMWILRLRSVELGLNYDSELQYFLG